MTQALLPSYRAYVVANIPQLQFLDDARVTRGEQIAAESMAGELTETATTISITIAGQ